MLRFLRLAVMGLILCGSTVAFVGCDTDGPVENAAEDVDEAADELD